MFEWDEIKNRKNQEQRGLGFDLIENFDFETARIIEGDRKEYGERRFRCFGRIDGIPYMIAFTPRHNKIRIISMRRMHEKEADHYGI